MSSQRKNFRRCTDDDEGGDATKGDDAGPPSRPAASKAQTPPAPRPRPQSTSRLSFTDDEDEDDAEEGTEQAVAGDGDLGGGVGSCRGRRARSGVGSCQGQPPQGGGWRGRTRVGGQACSTERHAGGVEGGVAGGWRGVPLSLPPAYTKRGSLHRPPNWRSASSQPSRCLSRCCYSCIGEENDGLKMCGRQKQHVPTEVPSAQAILQHLSWCFFNPFSSFRVIYWTTKREYLFGVEPSQIGSAVWSATYPCEVESSLGKKICRLSCWYNMGTNWCSRVDLGVSGVCSGLLSTEPNS